MPGASTTPTRTLKAKDVDGFTALPKERRYLNDAVSPLVVRAFGQKRSFVVRGRLPEPGRKYGKPVELVLPVPARGDCLADARHLARQWRELMHQGVDPRLEATEEVRRRAGTMSVLEAAKKARTERVEDHRDPDTLSGWDWLIKALEEAGGGIQHRPLDDVTVADLEAFCERVRQRARRRRAGTDGAGAWNEAVKWLRAVFGWAKRQQLIQGNLAELLRKRRIADGRRHIAPEPDPLPSEGIALLWRKLRHDESATGRMLGLILLTGLRADEAAALEWRHIRHGGPEPAIVLPASERKNGVGLELPLTDLLADYLLEWGAREGCPFVFAGRDGSGHVWRHPGKKIAELEKSTGWRPGPQRLRQTVRSRLARLGVDQETAEHILGHGSAGQGRNYLSDSLYERKLASLRRWHGWLTDLADNFEREQTGADQDETGGVFK